MSENKDIIGSDWAKVDAYELTQADYDEIPELTEEFFARATLCKGGRPYSPDPKKQVTMRLDAKVVEHFRQGGPGWQTRMNEALRKAAGI